ncbi:MULTISPECIES: hypothetical protein [Enterobacterales]|uniref:hypothetical protein n=1 Tax=Enterobacterales TaxID=91347 RepID=UPI0003BFD222|nr:MULTISPECIES: hypothetical protein [Enterobacteriaceae]EFA0779723.1 hypothetical protein [Escherichia coli]EFF9667480.1 hypothetical protein [Escherichia coli]EKJ3356011.1 hypothetical protein [Escherichia coli]ELS5398333.1 hypothetical protein [Escherichia coli]ESN47276.1 hypothetical protein L363_05117 [Klebsiella pneumoniae MGH 17]
MEANDFDRTEGEQYRLSWMAYIKPVFTTCLFIVGCVMMIRAQASVDSRLTNVLNNTGLWFIPYVLIVLFSILFVLRLIYLSKIRLYLNKNGVYVRRGIFPWTKGVYGTAWRDIADANYYTGFIPWLTKSYRVRVGHRFTKTSEIIVPNVSRGNEAVMKINDTINRINQTLVNEKI